MAVDAWALTSGGVGGVRLYRVTPPDAPRERREAALNEQIPTDVSVVDRIAWTLGVRRAANRVDLTPVERGSALAMAFHLVLDRATGLAGRTVVVPLSDLFVVEPNLDTEHRAPSSDEFLRTIEARGLTLAAKDTLIVGCGLHENPGGRYDPKLAASVKAMWQEALEKRGAAVHLDADCRLRTFVDAIAGASAGRR